MFPTALLVLPHGREKADVIQTMLFVAGLNTLLQTLFGTRLPAVIGSSYTYVPVAISIILSGRWNDPNPIERFKKTMRAIQGALIIASTIQIILGFSGLWRNAARMSSPLSAVPLVALAGFGLYEFGFPGVARCVEIGLPQLIILVLLSQQDKDMESKDLLEEETWIRMECIRCILDVEHHKSMDLRQRSRIRWASLVCMIDKACEIFLRKGQFSLGCAFLLYTPAILQWSMVTGSRLSIRAIQETTTNPMTPIKGENTEQLQSSPNWKVKMLYDGDCPLCMREVNMLKERNKDYNTINFVDISSDDYSPKDNQGLDYETAMGKIHAIMSDGTIVTNVEAFRKLYEAVGMGWIYAITKYEPVASCNDSRCCLWCVG